MVKKLKEETAKAVEEAEAAAEESGTLNPALEPDKIKTPLPGTTGDLDVMTTDEATSLNPNVTVSGTKPDGQGGQVLIDTVDPAVANAALLGPNVARKPQSPSEPPENTAQQPGEGQVLFETTADNEPFWSGNGVGQGGPLKKGSKVVMSKEEADLLVQTKAGRIVSSSSSPAPAEAAPAPKASAKNAKVEGSDGE
jgi:hypothetical protein